MSIEINNLSLGYQDKLVVKNLSLKFPRNKVIALIGPNGCCKSTTLKAVARLLKPKQGSITHKGQDIWQKSPKEYAQELAFLPQQHLVPEGIKVQELIAYGRSPYLNLWGKLSQKDEELVTWAMAQTQTAMTLAQDAELVLLDEPTPYLDLNRQAELMGMMRQMQQNGKTVITVLHDLNQACRYCDHLIVMKKGTVMAQGTPDEVMTEELLKDVFDLDVIIHRDPISNTPMFILK